MFAKELRISDVFTYLLENGTPCQSPRSQTGFPIHELVIEYVDFKVLIKVISSTLVAVTTSPL
jgi:hypothetical protein